MFSKFWFCLILIVMLGVSSYSFMLGSPFKTSDDNFSIVKNPLIQNSNRLSEIFTTGYFNDKFYYRPLVNVSYMLEYQRVGLNPFFFNWDNLMLHIINALLVWALVAWIMRNATIGFWVSLLFVIHPIHCEAVNNISGRAILLSASFALLSAVLFLKYQDYPRKMWLWILSAACFLLGLLCKESSGVLPVVLMLILWFRKKSMKGLWLFFAIIAVYLMWRHYLGITQTFPWHNATEAWLGFSTFLRSIFTHLKLLILPIGLYFDRSQRLFGSAADIEFIMTIVSVLAIIIVLFRYRVHISRLMVFLGVWAALELLPVSQLLTAIGVSAGRISSADHFLYLASVPIFLAFVLIVRYFYRLNGQRAWIDDTIFKGLIAGILIFYFMINIEQNIYASNEMSMLTRSVQYQPYNARIQSALGLLYAQKGDYAQAKDHFLWAVISSPENPRYRISLAKSLCDQGLYQDCLKIYNEIQNPGIFAGILEKNKIETQRIINEHNAQVFPK